MVIVIINMNWGNGPIDNVPFVVVTSNVKTCHKSSIFLRLEILDFIRFSIIHIDNVLFVVVTC